MSTNFSDFQKVGYGLMSFTWLPSRKLTQDQYNATLSEVLTASKASVENPLFLNGGEFYGIPDRHENIDKLGQFFAANPQFADKVFVSIKGGVDDHWGPDTSPERIQSTIDAINSSLKPLYEAREVRPKTLDMFTVSRVGKEPIEDVLKQLEQYKSEDKLSSICLSEVSASTLTKALKVATISAVEIEFSLFHRESATNGLFDVCQSNNIPVVCYSPLGKGLLVGIKPESLSKDDFRTNFDKFNDEQVIKNNNQLIDAVGKIAEDNNLTRSQVALSWITSVSGKNGYPKLLPIPGSATASRQIENLSVVELSDSILSQIDAVLKNFQVAGHRYNAMIDGSCNK